MTDFDPRLGPDFDETEAQANVQAMNKHPGFKSAAASIARRQGIPVARANAILASQTRGASAAAKRHNPRLKRVHGR
jgi:hypothetical protein